MKKILLAILVLTTSVLMAQTDVYLNINHLLGVQPFSTQTVGTNNLGNQFKVTRLQYYIAEIVLIHDGGTQTPVTDKYLLVDAKDSTNELLGTFNISVLEGIKFGIGVDAAKNHADPASYPNDHPLAPQSPSMHWGWSSGYRFVAMEGKAGNNFAYTFELHALDDANYFVQTVATSGTTAGNNTVITLNANYEKAIQNIDVSSGIVVHGSVNEAEDLLVNFNWTVFTSSEGNAAVGLEENDLAENISIYPNPIKSNGQLNISGLDNMNVSISDITGKTLVKEVAESTFSFNTNILSSGVYFVSVYKNAELIKVEKLVVSE